MASIREVSGIAEDLLCPVCFSIFQDPHMLGCGHNYCLSCLESCVPKGQQHGTCPECRNPFDLQNATRNRVLANLAEKARLLKLEEGSQPGGAGSWYFCEEHEEPLKLFCSQDEALVCVICRDLPQHQGHNFLPIKNAVKCYQDKLKISLASLEDDVKWATTNQSCQQEAIEELESLSEHLCGCIFISFEELREILNEREQSMLETVKQMKGLNQADMDEKLEYLKEYESSHSETISSIRAALEETNRFAFLKEVKELMGRIQDRLCERKEETRSEADEAGKGSKESEEKDHGSDENNENQADGKGNEDISGEGEDDREPQDIVEDEYEDIVPVDPSLEHLEELLCFETWKEMLRSISIEETYSTESYYSSSPPLEEDILQSGSNNISVAVEETQAKLTSTTETDTLIPGEGSFDKQMSSSNNCSNIGAPLRGAPCIPPQIPCVSNLQVPPFNNFQQLPRYNSVHGWGQPRRWTPHPKQGPGMSQGWGIPHRQPFHFNWGQGRGYPTSQMSQSCGGNTVSHNTWRPPKNEPPKVREGFVGKRGGWSNKPKPHSNGGSVSSQNGIKEPPKPREAHASRQDSSGQGQGSAKKPPTPHSGGKISSAGRGSQSSPHHGGGRGRGRGRGSNSAKGPRNK